MTKQGTHANMVVSSAKYQTKPKEKSKFQWAWAAFYWYNKTEYHLPHLVYCYFYPEQKNKQLNNGVIRTGNGRMIDAEWDVPTEEGLSTPD